MNNQYRNVGLYEFIFMRKKLKEIFFFKFISKKDQRNSHWITKLSRSYNLIKKTNYPPTFRHKSGENQFSLFNLGFNFQMIIECRYRSTYPCHLSFGSISWYTKVSTKVHGVLVFHVGVNPVPEKSHTGVNSRIFWICTAFVANRKYEY